MYQFQKSIDLDPLKDDHVREREIRLKVKDGFVRYGGPPILLYVEIYLNALHNP